MDLIHFVWTLYGKERQSICMCLYLKSEIKIDPSNLLMNIPGLILAMLLKP